MAECLASHRLKLMVEVTNQAASGYKAFDNRLHPLGPGDNPGLSRFFIPEGQSGDIET